LWDAREKIALQRSIEADGATRLGVGALVWADMNRNYKRPGSLPTRPPLPVDPEPIAIKARSIASLVADEAVTAEPVNEEGVPAHV
jgi:hypothetical protein